MFKSSVKIRTLSTGLLIILSLLIAVKLWRVGVPALSLYRQYLQVQKIVADPTALDIAEVQQLVARIHHDLELLQRELRSFDPFLENMGWVPVVGSDIQAAPALLAMGVSLSEAGDILLSAMDPAITALLADSPPDGQSMLPVVVETLAQAEPDFERARQCIDEARIYRQEVRTDRVSPQIAELLTRYDQVAPFIAPAFDLIKAAPSLLGMDESRTYLIIVQNNDELRATGGFISGLGTLTIEQGKINSLTFEDSYALDDFSKEYPDAPPQLFRYMYAWMWLFRDANWSPDYPTAVQAMLELYHISRATEVDGVIAVDQFALQGIVEALEPLSVPGWDEPTTGENVITHIRQSWSPGEGFEGYDREWYLNRKNFMGALATAMRDRVERTPSSVDWPKFGASILTILNERHVQIWLATQTAQAVFEQQGWAGAIRPASQDYLMIIDANLGFNKVNAVAETSFIYEVDLARNTPIEATLEVQHQNHSQGKAPCSHTPRYGKDYWEIMNRCYWNYMRVYTPRGSQLLDATPHAVAAEFLLRGEDEPAQIEHLSPEAGKTVWGTLILVAHRAVVETEFHYRLPNDVLEETAEGWRYHLTLQKQAGTLANPAQVVINLPPGSRVRQVSPLPRQTNAGQLTFDLPLRTDQEIDIVFE